MIKTITKEHQGYQLLNKYNYVPEILDALIRVSEFSRDKFYEPKACMISFAFTETFIQTNSEKNTTYRAKPKNEISILVDRLNKWFQRTNPESRKHQQNTFKFHFLWVKEAKLIRSTSSEWKALTKEEQARNPKYLYPHYHMMCFYDGKKATAKAFDAFMLHLEKEGKLRSGGCKVSRENGLKGLEALSKCLNTRYNDFMKHASYLAKEETKKGNKLSWDKSILR